MARDAGSDRGARIALALTAAVPAGGLLLTSAFTATGPKGVFQADLVALVAAAGCGGFLVRAGRRPLGALLVGAALTAPAHAAAAGGLVGAPAVALLALAASLGASGLAALGRGVGTPALTAGSVGASVLWIAMTGLLWADPVAETLAPARRFRFRQAVLHLDPATACAYDAARFDRFHDPRVYRQVPLASSLVRAPSAGPTGAAWLAVGLLGWGLAGLLGVDRRPPPGEEAATP